MMTWASFSEVDISATWRLYLAHVEAKGFVLLRSIRCCLVT